MSLNSSHHRHHYHHRFLPHIHEFSRLVCRCHGRLCTAQLSRQLRQCEVRVYRQKSTLELQAADRCCDYTNRISSSQDYLNEIVHN